MPDVRGTIHFLADIPLYKAEKPYRLMLPAEISPKGIQTHNLDYEVHDDVLIRDLRGQQADFKIELAGFEVVKHRSAFVQVEGEEALKAYKQETERFLRDHFDAQYVLCWDALIRKRMAAKPQPVNIRDRVGAHIPVYHAHNDETFDSGFDSLEFRLGSERARRFQNQGYRMRMVNTWRTLVDELEDNPLALCDWRSIDAEADLIETDQIVPSRETEIFHIFARPYHRWHWLSHQKSDELYVFLQFDTRALDKARCCLHSSFVNHDSANDAQVRHSIETRSVVITEQ